MCLRFCPIFTKSVSAQYLSHTVISHFKTMSQALGCDTRSQTHAQTCPP